MAVISLLFYVLWLLVREEPVRVGPKPDGERLLLMAIRATDGITPPETSSTVDEAGEILPRFADRGHLVVESRGGALLYALPGRRSSERL